MKKKVNIIIRLFCVIMLFAACNQEDITPITESEADKMLSLNVSISDYKSFETDSYTRATGTPDVGKSQWVSGDKVLVSVSLFADAQISGSPAFKDGLTFQYDGVKWNCIEGNLILMPFKDLNGRYQRYKAARVEGYYLPTHKWVKNSSTGAVSLVVNNEVSCGASESFACRSFDKIDANGLTSLDILIDFNEQMSQRSYSRLRIVTLPGHLVTLNGAGFRDASMVALGSSSTWAVSNNAITNSDANGNAFFYGKWLNSITFKVKIEKPQSGKAPLFVKEKSIAVSTASLDGVSYVIDMR